jgi:protein Tob/BTG
MRTEISNAANFLSNMIRHKKLSADKMSLFRDALEARFASSFTDHWFPEKPLKGNAYRCVRIVNNRMDKLVAAAGADAGLSDEYLRSAYPQELTVWIDPSEVSYRIGEDGSIGIIYSVLDNINENDSGKGSSDDELDSCSSDSDSYQSSSSSLSPSPTSSLFSLPMSSHSPVSNHWSCFGVGQNSINPSYLIGTCQV